jgi:pyruvate kinase
VKRRAKIIATIGPATRSKAQLQKLVEAGVDVARINMSHGNHTDHEHVIHSLREISQQSGKAVGIILDLQGPKIRTGDVLENQPIQLVPGKKLSLSTQPTLGTATQIHIDLSNLSVDLQVDDSILVDDGRIELKVTSILENSIETEVVTGGLLGSRKGVNFPGVNLTAPGLTEKDKQDLAFGLALSVDAIALSFVRQAGNILELKETIKEMRPQDSQPLIIAKLERPEALEHLDELIHQSDGIMVARGDLGVEISPEKVPSIQKQIIQKASQGRKIVITATQMLESMLNSPRPTRAEASDVANAIFDGSDALMLSGETAIGKYPIKTVQTMNRIMIDAEAHTEEWGRPNHQNKKTFVEDAVATTQAACELAEKRGARAIAVFTRSGKSAQFMANTRPCVPILAFTPEEKTYYQLSLLWGVEPHLVPFSNSVEEMIKHVEVALVSSEKVAPGQQVILVASLPIGAMGPANFALIHSIQS